MTSQTAIPMTKGIMYLIAQIDVVRQYHINQAALDEVAGLEPDRDWISACRHELFVKQANLAKQEGLSLNEITFQAIIGMNLRSEAWEEIVDTDFDDLPKRFAFDPWAGMGKGAILPEDSTHP